MLELFYVLLGKWKTIVLSLVLTGLCGYLISAFLITPQYESTSVLYVLSKSTSITSLAEKKVSTDNPTNTRLLKITVRDPNPQMAKAIADELADVSKSFILSK